MATLNHSLFKRFCKAKIIVLATILLQTQTFECWKIEITVNDDPHNLGIWAYTSRIPRSPVTEEDRILFQLSDENLRNAANMVFEEFPDNIYLKDPTPWNLYETYKWGPVERIVYVKPNITANSTERVEIPETSIPELLNKLHIPSAYWTKSDNESEIIEYNFEMNIELIINKTIHRSSKYWNTTWGESSEPAELEEVESTNESSESIPGFVESTDKNIESNPDFSTEMPAESSTKVESTNKTSELDPGFSTEKPVKTKKVYKRTLNLQVDFNACVRGYMAVNFSGKNSGHHFRALKITDVLERNLQLNSSFHNTQNITLIYYYV